MGKTNLMFWHLILQSLDSFSHMATSRSFIKKKKKVNNNFSSHQVCKQKTINFWSQIILEIKNLIKMQTNITVKRQVSTILIPNDGSKPDLAQ